MAKALIRLTSFVLIFIFPFQQILFANPAFGFSAFTSAASPGISELCRYNAATDQWRPVLADPAGTSHASTIDGNESSGDPAQEAACR